MRGGKTFLRRERSPWPTKITSKWESWQTFPALEMVDLYLKLHLETSKLWLASISVIFDRGENPGPSHVLFSASFFGKKGLCMYPFEALFCGFYAILLKGSKLWDLGPF